MPANPVSPEQLQEALNLVQQHGTITKAAAASGIPRTTLSSRYHLAKSEGDSARAEVPDLPSGELTIDELLALRKREFSRKRDYWEARKCIPIKVKIQGPFGIHFFGDPHLDDPGNDITQLEADVKLIKRTEAMLAANVGDTTNNWVGRLAVKYADQQATKYQGWQLTEWFISELKGVWLYLVAGNHDLWSGSSDPLQWIAGTAKTLYQPSQVRCELKATGDSIFVNNRHDFHGSSQFNPAHGPQKAAIFGYRDHLNVCGHLHKSGYGVWKDMATGRVCHNLQVASYKVYDDFARDKGFADLHISPSATVVIEPKAPEARKIHVFWELQEAVDFLKFKRRKAA